ncbi:MAG TPA: tRNA lysidine(34) synthetase TilS [Candidatus Tectomicrobia bacterium]|jgi:tRNA(Ile)-lysidine synthase|nr:tRNA lysidine(34) synthetase TilS [Candidatus Tectomicrobia bacterium]
MLSTDSRVTRDFPPDRRYLIGVSGGRDSVALLHWLISLGYERLVVCHLNHHLRGRSSDADAQFVKKLVERYNRKLVRPALLPPRIRAKAGRLSRSRTGKRSARLTTTSRIEFELGSANIRSLAKKQKMSIETAAREARYAFFAETARRRNCRTIFVAHHANDLVETFLINLFRGAGSAGLSAMREISTRRIAGIDLTIVRPFLSIWRKEIDDYTWEHQLKFREDATNKNLTPLRNRIRHRIIPYLEKTLGRNIRQNIWRTAIIAADEEKWIESELRHSTHADLSVVRLCALPVALQRRALMKWLRTQNVSDVGFDAIERVRSLADPDARIAKVNLSKNRHARRRAGKIFIE